MFEQTTAPALPGATGNEDQAVALLMQVMNAMERCRAMLLANEPMYGYAVQSLHAAQTALHDLAASQGVPPAMFIR